eukprot:s2794_g15.t1
MVATVPLPMLDREESSDEAEGDVKDPTGDEHQRLDQAHSEPAGAEDRRPGQAQSEPADADDAADGGGHPLEEHFEDAERLEADDPVVSKLNEAWMKYVDLKNITMVEVLESRELPQIVEAIGRVYARLRALGVPVLRIHTDREKGFLSRSFQKWCRDHNLYQTIVTTGRPTVGWAGEERCRSQLAALGVPSRPMIPLGEMMVVKVKRRKIPPPLQHHDLPDLLREDLGLSDDVWGEAELEDRGEAELERLAYSPDAPPVDDNHGGAGGPALRTLWAGGESCPTTTSNLDSQNIAMEFCVNVQTVDFCNERWLQLVACVDVMAPCCIGYDFSRAWQDIQVFDDGPMDYNMEEGTQALDHMEVHNAAELHDRLLREHWGWKQLWNEEVSRVAIGSDQGQAHGQLLSYVEDQLGSLEEELREAEVLTGGFERLKIAAVSSSSNDFGCDGDQAGLADLYGASGGGQTGLCTLEGALGAGTEFFGEDRHHSPCEGKRKARIVIVHPPAGHVQSEVEKAKGIQLEVDGEVSAEGDLHFIDDLQDERWICGLDTSPPDWAPFRDSKMSRLCWESADFRFHLVKSPEPTIWTVALRALRAPHPPDLGQRDRNGSIYDEAVESENGSDGDCSLVTEQVEEF